jgi:hypothetical protein
MMWQHISPEVNVKCFQKFCISSAMDGTDGGMLWNGIEEDGNDMSVCAEDKGTDCEDGESDIDWKRQIESDTLCISSVCN